MQLTCSEVLFISVVLVLIREYSAQSPCTQFFELRTDEAGSYGIIHLFPREQVTSISTRINFTIATTLPSHYSGRLEPLGEPASLIQQFNQGYPIEYRMHFPVDSPVLQITSIVVNNDLICIGPPGLPAPHEKVTSLSLAHFLNDRSIRPPQSAFSSSFKQQQVSNNPFGLNNISPYIVITNSQVDLLGQGRPQQQIPYYPPGPSYRDPATGLWQPQTYAQPSPMQPGLCVDGQFSGDPSDCTRYRFCRYGKFEEYSCTAGQHWNEEKKLCDWISNGKCEVKLPTTTPEPESEEETEEESAATLPPVTPQTKPALLRTPYKLVCYYTSWSWYRPGAGKFVPEDIDPSLCTHVVYGFAILSNGFITEYDAWADVNNRFYERIIELKKYGVKVSIGLGGWEDSAGDKYSVLVNSPEARANFIQHAVKYIEKYKFDGLDLHWEYPKCWQADCSQGPDSDKEGFANLVRELSAVFKPKGLLLSSAVSSNKMVIDASYDVPTLAQYLDWIAVMAYDYHGKWDKKTGHGSPLYYHPSDDNRHFNANFTIHYWMDKGAPASKLVMGIPFSGQSFTLGSQWDLISNNGSNIPYRLGLNVAATGGGDAGKSTEDKGFLAYYEICNRIRKHKWTVVKDPKQRMGPYAFKGKQWVSFDDTEIIKKKVDFITSLNLAGGMVWTIDLDDFKNRCKEGKYTLLNTIKKAFLESHTDAVVIETKPTTLQPSDKDNVVQEIDERLGLDQPLTESITKPTITSTTTTAAANPLSLTNTLITTPVITEITTETTTEIATEITTLTTSKATTLTTARTTTTARAITEPTTTVITFSTTVPTILPTTTSTTTEAQIVDLPMEKDRFKVVCYYTNWAWYRPGSGKYSPEDIDPTLCTHIVYAFAVLDSNQLVMKSNDNWLDVQNKFYERVVALKSQGVKVLLGLGGWSDSAGNKYSRLVNNKSARRKFVTHALEYVKKYKFDGLDLDWQYPVCWQFDCGKGPSTDKQGFADLIKELHAAFSAEELLLSAIVSSNQFVIDIAYNIPSLAQNLDWVTLMTYNYHGPWDQKTGLAAPVYDYRPDDDKSFNVNFTVNYWISKGTPREKLVVGMPLFGQSYSLVDNTRNGLGDPVHAAGEAGDETKSPGMLAFYEICDRIKSHGWEMTRSADGSYATLEDQWVSFDDDSIIRRKAEYVAAMDLGGSMVWTLDLDDFTGKHCGCGKFPLLSNINHVLRRRATPPSCSFEVPSTQQNQVSTI